MKIKLVLISILILQGMNVIAQKTNVLVWDASNPSENSIYWESSYLANKKLNTLRSSTKKKLRITTNELLAIKVINANPYKYVYAIDGTPIEFFSENTSEYFGLLQKIQTKIEQASDAPSDVESDDSSPILTPTESILKNEELEKKQVELNSNNPQEITNSIEKIIDNQAQEIEALNKEADSTLYWWQSKKSIPEGLTKQMKENQSLILAEVDKIEDKIENFNSLIEIQKDIIQKQQKNLKIQNSNIQKLSGRINTLEKQKKSLIKERDSLKKELEKKQKFIDVKKRINNVLVKLAALNNEFERAFRSLRNEDSFDKLEFEIKLNELKKNFDSYKEEFEKILLEYEGELNEKDTKLLNTLIDSKYNPILKLLSDEISLLTKLKFDFFEYPIEFDGENIDAINIEITRSLRTDSNKKKTYNYKVWIKGGFKFDVSAGMFFSSLDNRSYGFPPETLSLSDGVETTVENEEDTDDGMDNSSGDDNETTGSTGNAIIRDNLGGWEYGFGTMLNVSFRTGTWVRPTFSFGAMLTDDTKFQVLTGMGMILGKKSRIILNSGLAMGRVTRLASGYVADGNTMFNISQENNIPTVEKFSANFFCGITYNLSKPKTDN